MLRVDVRDPARFASRFVELDVNGRVFRTPEASGSTRRGPDLRTVRTDELLGALGRSERTPDPLRTERTTR